MPENSTPNAIMFDNIIVPVNKIVDVEFPETINGSDEKYHIVIVLESSRIITMKCNDEKTYNARKSLFTNLFKPEDWDELTNKAIGA